MWFKPIKKPEVNHWCSFCGNINATVPIEAKNGQQRYVHEHCLQEYQKRVLGLELLKKER